MIKAVLSDLGNVVVWYDNQKFIDALNGFAPITPLSKDCFEHGAMSSLSRQFSGGRIGPDAFRHKVIQAYFDEAEGSFPNEEQFDAAYAKVLTPNRPVMDLWQKLHGCGYTLTAVSDIDPLRHVECKTLGVFDPFDFAVLSYEVGKMKPSKLLLKKALSLSRALPEEAVYIDDVIENLASAEALGIPCHLYRCDNDLHKFLRQHGVRVD